MDSPPRSLWASAAAMLDDADQKLLILNENDCQHLDVIDSFGKTTQEAYQVCVRKRWKIKLPGQQDKIIVRDLLKRIMHWVEVFKSVGDQAVSFDPGHVALPWAGARFLLQIALNDFKQFDFVVQGAERIVQITARYRIMEDLYLHRSGAATDLLEQAVVRLYSTMLRYLVHAKRYFQQRTAARILKSGLLAQADFEDLLDQLDAEEKEADRCADLAKTDLANDAADRLESLSLAMKNLAFFQNALDRSGQPIFQGMRQLDRVEDYLDGMQRKAILDWLSTQPYHDYHTDIMPKVLEGTCQWVVKHREFVKWQNDSKNTLLWLHGMQGSGKSCLTSTVIDKVMKSSETDEMYALAFFYCSRSTVDPQRASPRSILACIARQLSRRSMDLPLAAPTRALYEKLQSVDGSTKTPTIPQLCDLIRELTELYDRTMIIVDALDECEVETRSELIDAFQLISESSSLVKVFVSSREEGDLRLSLQTHGGVHITSLQNSEDIQRFVEYETDRLIKKNQLLAYIRKKQTKDELAQLIKEDIICKANGMFRWAELQLQSLRGIRIEKDIRSELSRIPRDLKTLYQDLYDRALESTQETDAAVFRHTLKWLLSAQRNLGQQDFFYAVTAFADIKADEIDEEFILDLLNNFVVASVNEEGKRFFLLAHLSVREFLEKKAEYTEECTHTFAAEVCLLTMISSCGSSSANEFIDSLGIDPIDLPSLPEVDYTDGEYNDGKDIQIYALDCWIWHCVLAGRKNRTTDDLSLCRLFNYFLFDATGEDFPMESWAQYHYRSQDHEILDILLNHDDPHERAFLLACQNAFPEIVQLGLDRGVDSRLEEEGALLAFSASNSAIDDLLLTQDDPRLRLHVLHNIGKLASWWRVIDPQRLSWLLAFIEPLEITEEVITQASSPCQKEEIISMLLDHNPEIRITAKNH